jgi:hypothetical protein
MVIKRQGKYTQITVVRNTMAFTVIDELVVADGWC